MNTDRSDDSGIFLSRNQNSHFMPAWTPGTQIMDGQYLVIDLVGKGGAGTVYRAYDRSMQRDVALKVSDLHPEILEHEERIYSMLSGQNGVITFYGKHTISGARRDTVVLCMEYAPGGTFLQWMLRHRNDHITRIRKGVRHFMEICNCVESIHRAGILHMDVKPSNFLITTQGMKIADFGSSRLLHGQSVYRSGQLGMTTPEYEAPEMWEPSRHCEIGTKTDCYSLGVLAYQLFDPFCTLPFAGSPEMLRHAHLHQRPPRLRGVSKEVADVVERCLKKF